jgi:hypothetical protein
MILQLFLLFGQQATSADQVLDRFANARKTPLRVEAAIDASIGDSPNYATKIWVDGQARTLFLAKSPSGVYRASLKPSLIRETDETSKMYDEHPYHGWSLQGLRLSPAATLFPSWMAIPDLRKIAGAGKWELKGYQVRDGIGFDRLHLRSEQNGAGVEMNVDVDSRGFIVGFDQDQWNPMGRMRRKWIVTNYRPRVSFTSSEIELPVPIGYMPFALDYPQIGVVVGDMFPLKGWSRPLTPKAKSLVVLYGEDCEPSRKALPWLQGLQKRMPITYISDGSPKLVPSALSDRSGKLLEKLSYQATPTMYLLDEKGKVIGIWMGYDPAKAASVQKEIIEVAAGGDLND